MVEGGGVGLVLPEGEGDDRCDESGVSLREGVRGRGVQEAGEELEDVRHELRDALLKALEERLGHDVFEFLRLRGCDVFEECAE